MKNEFIRILSELSQAMSKKVDELTSFESFDAYTQGRINNLNKRILGLENSSKDILENYSANTDMLINFKKRAIDILKEIEDLHS